MSDSCVHRRDEDGVCIHCGDCSHEVILNRVCTLCGATDVTTTVADPTDFVPAARLVRRDD